jgi:hypothetical protein
VTEAKFILEFEQRFQIMKAVFPSQQTVNKILHLAKRYINITRMKQCYPSKEPRGQEEGKSFEEKDMRRRELGGT